MTTPPAVHDGRIILCGVLAANPVASVQLRAGASVHLLASLKWETSRLGACDGHCYLIMVEFFVRMKDTGGETWSVSCSWGGRARQLSLSREVLSIRANKGVLSCPCQTSKFKDSCLVGRWRVVSGDCICRKRPVGRTNNETKREGALHPKHQHLHSIVVGMDSFTRLFKDRAEKSRQLIRPCYASE